MNLFRILALLILFAVSSGWAWFLIATDRSPLPEAQPTPPGRSEVVFWHFWGGPDREVVEDVVRRFNESQNEYFVRAIMMPGNNLQAKLFLSVAGGDPPDLINQDDPILADWAQRGIIQSIEDIASPSESAQINDWLFDSARRLSTYDGRLFAVCNGLDIRALYYNKTALDQADLKPPQTVEQLDQIVETLTPPSQSKRERYAYLPDTRRLWAWGFVFGGQFLSTSTDQAQLDSRPIVTALEWMQSFGDRYGPHNIAAFRTGDQSLPGKSFPLLPLKKDQLIGRYVLLMDGQWRVRDINEFLETRRIQQIPAPEFGVTALPPPTGGRRDAGWVNGNFFVIPRGAKNGKGSLEFIKFWIGMHSAEEAAKTNIAGGWIPVSDQVVQHDAFQKYLDAQPLFREFVRLASSPNQFPIPLVPGAPMFNRTVESAGYEGVMNPQRSATEILSDANTRIQAHLERARGER